MGSFILQSYDKPKASSKASSAQSVIWCFLFHFPVSSLFFLRSSSNCLHLLRRLVIFSSITRFRRQILHKMWPIHLAFSLFIECKIFLSRSQDSIVGVATCYGLDSPGIESLWETRFFVPVQTGSEAHPASYIVGTGSFPGVKRRGVALNTHPHLAPRLRKE